MARLMRVGVFGGTFDPPHIGHLILAAETRSQLNLDRLLWVLTPDPPHKQRQYITPSEQRLEMVQAAILDDPGFELSRVEIDRPGPHYAVDTLHLLAKDFPGADLAYLVGGDSLRDLPTWYHPQELVDACAIIGVMRRPGDAVDLEALETLLPGIKTKLAVVTAPLLEVSASEIRSRIAGGRPYRYYLPEAVYKIIQEQGLYSQN
jgi:nicotinate-nucleotide adenylyltransferase